MGAAYLVFQMVQLARRSIRWIVHTTRASSKRTRRAFFACGIATAIRTGLAVGRMYGLSDLRVSNFIGKLLVVVELAMDIFKSLFLLQI